MPLVQFSWSELGHDVKNDWSKIRKNCRHCHVLFIEKGLGGGSFYIAKRYAKANNKYMNNYDPTKPSKFITYLDMSNLYGYLPYGGFKWLKNVDGFDVNSISEKSPIGYILEVNLEYPDELHLLHNDYPLAPENLQFLMTCCNFKKLADEYGIKAGDVLKLIPNLGNKTDNVHHYRNLQLYLSLGIKLTKIYRVLKFRRSDWIKKYIDFNTEKRTNAANSFEKDFFKLMINSVYGKIMEKNTLANQLILLIKFLIKITPLFMKLHQF